MGWCEELDQKVRAYLPDLKIRSDVPLSGYTSFQIGGPARRMAFPSSGEQLVLLHSFAVSCGARPLIVGKGSNLLVPDQGLDRLVIQTAEGLQKLETGGEPDTLLAESGVSLARLAEFARRRGLTGLEFAHGIPGTLGGAVCMNAGAYGGEMAQVVESAAVLFPEEGVRILSREELNFGYRHSVLTERPDAVVLHAVLRLRPGDPEAVGARMRELMSNRKARQPLEYPSAGSTFKRPEGHYAAALIDQCGLKGLSVGAAKVSEKHAGFVINRGGASFADVTELIRRIQAAVLEKTGVQLEPEVKILED